MADLFQIVASGADRVGNAAVAAFDGIMNAAATYGPGLLGSAASAAAYGAREVNAAANNFFGAAVDTISPYASPAAASPDFGSMLQGAGLNLGWAQGAAQAPQVDVDAPYHGLGGQGAGYRQQQQGFALGL